MNYVSNECVLNSQAYKYSDMDGWEKQIDTNEFVLSFRIDVANEDDFNPIFCYTNDPSVPMDYCDPIQNYKEHGVCKCSEGMKTKTLDKNGKKVFKRECLKHCFDDPHCKYFTMEFDKCFNYNSDCSCQKAVANTPSVSSQKYEITRDCSWVSDNFHKLGFAETKIDDYFFLKEFTDKVYTPQECELKCNELLACRDFVLGTPLGTNNGNCRLYREGWLFSDYVKTASQYLSTTADLEYQGVKSITECKNLCQFEKSIICKSANYILNEFRCLLSTKSLNDGLALADDSNQVYLQLNKKFELYSSDVNWDTYRGREKQTT